MADLAFSVQVSASLVFFCLMSCDFCVCVFFRLRWFRFSSARVCAALGWWGLGLTRTQVSELEIFLINFLQFLHFSATVVSFVKKNEILHHF